MRAKRGAGWVYFIKGEGEELPEKVGLVSILFGASVAKPTCVFAMIKTVLTLSPSRPLPATSLLLISPSQLGCQETRPHGPSPLPHPPLTARALHQPGFLPPASLSSPKTLWSGGLMGLDSDSPVPVPRG